MLKTAKGKTMKVFTIGGATQDIFLHYAGADVMTINKQNFMHTYMLFESGEKVEIEKLTYLTGGGATNSATSFKRLGFDVSCFCNLGNDPAGMHVRKDLETNGVDTSFISTSTEHPTGVSCILDTIHGDRTIFAFRGANSYLELDKLPFDEIKHSKQLYITSLSNNSARLLPDIVSFAKQNNVPVAINPGVSQLAKGTLVLKKSLQYIDILILNSSEARTFMLALIQTDEAYKKAFESSSSHNPCALNQSDADPYLMESPLVCENTLFSMHKFFKEVLKMGPRIVVVTNGANGVYVASHNTIYFHPSIKTNTINTVGAGDAFGSCFVASLLLGNDIPAALRNGIINSASVLNSLGAKAGLLTYKELKDQAHKTPEDLLKTFKL
jgi:sugar/nucleoside kinase (ribokinase family)